MGLACIGDLYFKSPSCDAGIDVNITHDDGNTALRVPQSKGHEAMVVRLMPAVAISVEEKL